MSVNAITRIVRAITMDYEEQVDDQVARTATKIRGAAQIAKEAVREITDLHVTGAEGGSRLYMAEKFYVEQLKAIGIPEDECKLVFSLYRHNGVTKVAQLLDYGSEIIVDEAEMGI